MLEMQALAYGASRRFVTNMVLDIHYTRVQAALHHPSVTGWLREQRDRGHVICYTHADLSDVVAREYRPFFEKNHTTEEEKDDNNN